MSSSNASKRISSSGQNDDGKRRRSSRSVSPVPSRRDTNDGGDIALVPVAKKTRTSLRNIKYCCDINNIPNEFKCGGCSRWDDSRKSKPRDQIVTREYQCCRVWRLEEDDVPDRLWKHYENLVGFIESELHIDRSALLDEPVPASTTNNDNDNDAPVPTPSPKQRNVTFIAEKFYSQWQYFEFEIPSSHKIEHISDIKRWRNGCDTADRIKAKFKRKLYRTDCLFTQALWAIATSAVPALALSAAQWLFPLIILAFLYDTGIFEDGVPSDTFPKSFPSDGTLRKYTIN